MQLGIFRCIWCQTCTLHHDRDRQLASFQVGRAVQLYYAAIWHSHPFTVHSFVRTQLGTAIINVGCMPAAAPHQRMLSHFGCIQHALILPTDHTIIAKTVPCTLL